jgi:hypothetical protein
VEVEDVGSDSDAEIEHGDEELQASIAGGDGSEGDEADSEVDEEQQAQTEETSRALRALMREQVYADLYISIFTNISRFMKTFACFRTVFAHLLSFRALILNEL